MLSKFLLLILRRRSRHTWFSSAAVQKAQENKDRFQSESVVEIGTRF